MATQTTASYRVELDIQPAMMMLTSGTDDGMIGMTATDGGQTANHFFQVRIANTAAGAPADTSLSIAIANDMTGEMRNLSSMMSMNAMMSATQMGMEELQFANNVYLPDGSYTITVMVGTEAAQFNHVMVAGAMGMH